MIAAMAGRPMRVGTAGTAMLAATGAMIVRPMLGSSRQSGNGHRPKGERGDHGLQDIGHRIGPPLSASTGCGSEQFAGNNVA
jgi:hypothetical protein